MPAQETKNQADQTPPSDLQHDEQEERREQREDDFRKREEAGDTFRRSYMESTAADAIAAQIEPLHERIRQLEEMLMRLSGHAQEGQPGMEDDVVAGVAAEFHRYHNRWRNLEHATAELTGAVPHVRPGIALAHQVPKMPGELPPPAEPAAAHPEGRPPAQPLRATDPPPQGNVSQPGIARSSTVGPQTGTGPGTGSPVDAERSVMGNAYPAGQPREQPLSEAQVQAERDVARGKAAEGRNPRPAVREVGPGAQDDDEAPQDATDALTDEPAPPQPPKQPQGRRTV